ncbi:type II secretion system ATPase GspE [Desulfobacula sp.]|uniref:type II secretion system ATPase GspE n=1 Tax=Desulfobacula sp. TaxID=2593537 RepID=UPI0025B831C9|nr:type II secretion system ATPase GspE [Desulfobacula sp.]MBC2704561.1 type II secretion system ATPase GspE [Desulfobacula sp.]
MIEKFITILAKRTSLSRENCEKIRGAYAKDRSRLIDATVETRLVPENEVLEALSLLYSIPFKTALPMENIRDDWTAAISRQFLKKACIAPLAKEDDSIIAVNDPSDLSFVDDVAALLNLDEYSLVLAPKNQILSAVNILYDRSGESAQQLVEDMEDNGFTIIDDFDQTADLLDDTSDAPVIRLVNHMISQAVKAGASDIHIEPFQDALTIRYRIDGILYEMLSPPKGVQASMISRIKVMAKMNIAEKRVPQDGRAQVRIGDQEIDIRISTVPTSYGERLVMRLLNKSGYFLEFSEFGLSDKNYNMIHTIIRQNNGIVLVTGPTGSGKTTTLYAALSEINAPDKNIITIEDPVEYKLKGIGQIQVNTKTGVTFAKGLRSIVRQDPDIILVGEIRDLETAEISIQSALTGHLVFSTLHTNDAAGAITRLVDLGVEPYLISSAVSTVIAQRLIRVLCNDCKEKYRLSPSHIRTLNGAGEEYIGKYAYQPKGCSKCFNTGYSGRKAIFEIMRMDDALKNLVLETSDANQIKDAALKSGMITLRRDGMSKVLKGITSIREVLRVTQE